MFPRPRISAAKRRGAPAVRMSVFDEVPRTGSWATALLLDGNIGIGGDPAALLARVHQLLAPAGAALVELDPPELPAGRFQAYVEHAGRIGPRFPWARVGPAQINELAAGSSFEVGGIAQRGRTLVRPARPSRWAIGLGQAAEMKVRLPAGPPAWVPHPAAVHLRWRSPIRGPWLTSVFGAVLLVGIPIEFITGLVSWAAYNPRLTGNDTTPQHGILSFYLFNWVTSPSWIYRVSQGIHVLLGLALVPVVLAKLWSVIPRLFAWPPLRSLASLLERPACSSSSAASCSSSSLGSSTSTTTTRSSSPSTTGTSTGRGRSSPGSPCTWR